MSPFRVALDPNDGRATATEMKAIVYRKYGPPEVLRLEDIEKPSCGAGEVLIRIRAASVNPVDWHLMRGKPYFMRMMAGFFAPKTTRLGADVAGEVEAVGEGVRHFKPGDAVFGACRGSFAEYACVPESALLRMPETLTFEEGGSICVAALTALQGLRAGGIQPGQSILINGAAGGVGTFAVQIAKALGSQVTAVCSARNADLVRGLGADQVIDYAKEDFSSGAARYDILLDSVGNHPLLTCRRVLSPKGVFIMNGGPDGPLLGPAWRGIRAVVLSRLVSQKFIMFMTRRNPEDLAYVRDLIEQGKVRPVIDRTYTLAQTAEAIRYLETGHARAKVVITVP